MKFLNDTRLLLWAAGSPRRLSAQARKLLSQALTEGFTLLTSDPAVARYSWPIRLV